jgi:hypothetical protein
VHNVSAAKIHGAKMLEKTAQRSIDMEFLAIAQCLADGSVGAQDFVSSDDHQAEGGE